MIFLSFMMIFLLQTVFFMVTDAEWQAKAKGILKGELKRRGVGYRDLAEKLASMGVPETEQNIANKISRGGFSAVFLIQCMEAVGCRNLQIGGD